MQNMFTSEESHVNKHNRIRVDFIVPFSCLHTSNGSQTQYIYIDKGDEVFQAVIYNHKQ